MNVYVNRLTILNCIDVVFCLHFDVISSFYVHPEVMESDCLLDASLRSLFNLVWLLRLVRHSGPAG